MFNWYWGRWVIWNYGKPSVFLDNFLGFKRHVGNFLREKNLDFLKVFPSASKYHPNIFNEYTKSSKLFNKEWLYSFQPEVTENFLSNNQYKNIADFITEYDMKTQLPEEFLFMTDRFSMAHSLEVRTPFLDINLVEKVLSLKNTQRYRKVILNLLKMFKNSLPNEIISGRKKGLQLI